MAVTDEHVAAVRAFLARDFDEAERLYDRISGAGVAELQGYGSVVLAAFVEAAYRHFAPVFDVGDVVRYVAAVRARGVGRTSWTRAPPRW